MNKRHTLKRYYLGTFTIFSSRFAGDTLKVAESFLAMDTKFIWNIAKAVEP